MHTYSDVLEYLESCNVLEGDFQFYYTSRLGIFGDDFEVADSYTSRHGFRPIGKQWCGVSRSVASDYLSRLLNKSLAYGIEMFPRSKSEFIANRIVSLVDESAGTFMVNGSFYDSGFGCPPIGVATFELAIVFFDQSNIGFFYIEDED